MNISSAASSFSTPLPEQPFQMITRVLSNVVDMQQNMITNFSTLTTQIESLRVEVRTTIMDLRSDVKRLEDRLGERGDKHVGDMRESHDKEMDRMIHLLELLSVRPSPAPCQQPVAATQRPVADATWQQQFGLQQQALMQQQQYQQLVAAMRSVMQPPPQPAAAPVSVAAAPVASSTLQPQLTFTSPAVGGAQSATSPIPVKPALSFATPSPPQTTPAAQVVVKPVASTVASSVAPSTAVVAKPGAPAASPFGAGFFSKGSASVPSAAVAPVLVRDDEEEEEREPEEYEPTATFQPVIPLPELVDVVTGEEGEKVLFESRCKVYRFVDKEWKERGIGQIKVLEHPNTRKCRIVMRREQVHKVCVNHYLDSGMKIEQMSKNTKAVSWVCMDASDGDPEFSKLSARFPNEELAAEFKKTFEKCVSSCPPIGSTPVKKEVRSEAEDVEKSDEDEEELVPLNDKEEKVGDQTKGFDWKPQEGSWNCEACYANNPGTSSKCACCGTGKNGEPAEQELKTNISAPASSSFSFGFSASTSKPAEPATCNTKSPFSFSAPSKDDKPLATTFSFGQKPAVTGAATTAPSTGAAKVSFADAAKAAANDEPKSTSAPTFSFGKPAASAAASAGSASPLFSFKTASPQPQKSLFGGSAVSSSGSVFGGSLGAAASSKTSEETTADKEEPKNVFGSGSVFGGGQKVAFSFSSPSQQKGNIFEGRDAEKAKEAFGALKKAQPLGAKAAQKDAAGEEEEGADEEYEPDVEFKPVIPLPDLVEVKTGEEGEEEVFKERCKLYRFDRVTKETKERGLGDIKILRNPATGNYRVVMRREQVHKLCANFRLLTGMRVTEKKGNPAVYTFNCKDFSESTEGTDEMFFAKFKGEDVAKKFAEAFEAGVAAHK